MMLLIMLNLAIHVVSIKSEGDNESMKSLKELIDGKCMVITEDGKQYNGFYNKKLEVAFFCIPAHKKVIGYIQ